MNPFILFASSPLLTLVPLKCSNAQRPVSVCSMFLFINQDEHVVYVTHETYCDRVKLLCSDKPLFAGLSKTLVLISLT